MSRTKVDAELEAAMQEHADDPERAEVLHRARRFKSSWLELAEALTAVRREEKWRAWGYDSLEQYAKVELHLRQETVEKLTGSYSFLQRRAPEVLRRDGVKAPIPCYQSVDLLRRAEEREDAPTEAVHEIRRRVLDEGVVPSAISRTVREAVFPIDDRTKKQRDAAALRNVGGKLVELLGDTRAVPKTLAREVAAAVERLLEAVRDAKDKEEAA